MAISKKNRFEVFKRDSFVCQYCGASAPDVTLEADHIEPVAAGGSDDLMNLITSCRACNAGKSDRKLGDHTVVRKQKAQLDELNERREQIEMLMEWQRGLAGLDDDTLDRLADYWNELTPGFELSESGRRGLQKLLRRHTVAALMEAMRTSTEQYLERDKSGALTHDSVNKSFDYVGRICSVEKASKDKPYLRDLFYARGILRNRLAYVNDRVVQMMEDAHLAGVSVEAIKDLARSSRSWTAFRDALEDAVDDGGRK